MSVVINMDVAELAQRFELDKVKFEAAVEKAGEVARFRGAALLTQNTPTDLGQARGGWRIEGRELHNIAPHSGVLEAGARPHGVSEEGKKLLFDWVMRVIRPGGKVTRGRLGQLLTTGSVGVEMKTSGSERRALGKVDALLAEAKGIVYAIVAKYKREGQKGHFFTKAAIPRLMGLLSEETIHYLERAGTRRQ